MPRVGDSHRFDQYRFDAPTLIDAARINLGGGILGGDFGGPTAPLTPGVYTFGTGVTISDDITFEGKANDIFIIQMTGNLRQDANVKVILKYGVQAKNIFWQVAGNVKLMAGAHMEGVLLVKTDVTFITSSSLNGRVLSQTACNLQMATVEEPEAKPYDIIRFAGVEPDSAGVAVCTSFLGLFAMIFAMAL
jgi:hypothetical protein